MTQPRILLITRNLPPLVGGMERLNWHMADELSEYAEVKAIGPKGATATKPPKTHLTEAPLKPLPLFLVVAFFKAVWMALRWRPDVILAGSGLTAPIAWLASKVCRARSAVYLHGFDITVKNTLYQRLWVPTFRKIDHIIVNSTPTKGLAFAAGVPERKITIVHPGVNLPDAPQPAENVAAFKAQHGLADKKILLSVGRLTTRKGLREFVELALPAIMQAEPSTMLVVVGDAPKDSLGAGIQTMESIQAQAKQSGVGGHIKFLGVITEKAQLATAYEAADVHVFPVRHIPNDPEGFGMVAIEAAAHGLPTVAFATGGVVDAVSHGESGYLVEQDNYKELTQPVLALLRQPMATESITRFAQRFAWFEFGSQVHAALSCTATPSPSSTMQKASDRISRQTAPERQPHAALEISSRRLKALKIERLLNLKELPQPIKLLEIGCGSGGIAHYFATHPDLTFQVTAVDVNDNRQVHEDYEYHQVQGVELPFYSEQYDVVITNHVIEHVGDAQAQIHHLREIYRVLKPHGIGYLAVPNRWMLTEPHYRLKFLSWLPRSWRSRYLRLMGKGTFYDCEPLEMRDLERMLDSAELDYSNLCIEGWRVTFDIERSGRLATKTLAAIPDVLLKPLKPLIPTLIYKIERPGL